MFNMKMRGVLSSEHIGNRSRNKATIASIAATAALLSSCHQDQVANVAAQPEQQLTVVEETPEQQLHPHQNVIDCMVEKCIALTFDDGPGIHTERLLTALSKHDAKATFFATGRNVVTHPAIVHRIKDEGHQIGGHSWDHQQLTTINVETAQQDTANTNRAIANILGEQPTIMRPPYGAISESLAQAIAMPQIIWSVDTNDWRYRDSDYVANHVLQTAGRGDIVLMHDIHKTTVDAVPRIVDGLTEQGYKLVTIDTLFNGNRLSPGIYYRQPPIEPTP